MEVPAILDSIDKSLLNDGLSSVSDRYYEHKYCNKLDGVQEAVAQCVSFHSNKICMLSLAEDHPILTNKLVIKNVNFEINDKLDRSKNSVSGKGKRGAQYLNPDSVICYLETDSEKFPVYSCIKGKLIEVNESLIGNPNLLVDKPRSEGYIALLLPVLREFPACKESMLNKDQYVAVCS